jgi:two-component system, response regulator PdtaR
MRILVVEDEPVLGLMVACCLQDAGHQVIGPAATLSQALKLCADEPPDIALLDINLGDGSNGVDLARALFAQWAVLSVFVTGAVMEARQGADIAFGCLEKPYEAETLLDIVEMAHAASRGAEAGCSPAGFELYSRRH